MYRLFLGQFFVFLFPMMVNAQGYGTALGLRLSGGFGGTLQQQVSVHWTVEGIVQGNFASKDITLTFLGENHKSLLSKKFNAYSGLGIHKTWAGAGSSTLGSGGITGIIGAELALGDFCISADFKPNLTVFGCFGLNAEAGISLRYIIAGRYFKDGSWWKFWE
jgi:hypothetical protein